MENTWDQIAESFAQAIRNGDAPSVDAIVEQHSDPTGELKALLQSIEMIESLKQTESAADETFTSEFTEDLKRLDDYEIVGEIGRGGMGVVFEAIHESLGRRVAIKVFSASALGDDRLLQRFQQEAQAAARLRHSHIVPVYGVGRSDRFHYYVMDLVDGMSVRQWLREIGGQVDAAVSTIDESMTSGTMELHTAETHSRLSGSTITGREGPRVIRNLSNQPGHPSYFRCVAEKIADVCDGLDYAHQQGTLHRDIKPANLLFDLDGAIWITDFGLAKLDEASDFTRTGDIVGTPQYMPPESFEGRYDERSEVYAVGLTLYELLSLRPAISATSQAEAIRMAMSGVSSSPRKHSPSLPKDLETITMKALAHEPDRRYQSTRRLRDDLQRFLANRPIAARRVSFLQRAARWSRREPLAASLTAAVFLSLVALTIVSAVGYFRTRTLLSAAELATRQKATSLRERGEALRVAQEQQTRATKNLSVAIDAFDQIVANVAQRGVDLETESFGDVGETISPDVSAADAELLQSLLGFFDELADSNREDFRAQSAAALRRVGDIYQRLGELKKADDAYEQSLQRYRELDASDSASPSVKIEQAAILNEQSNIAGLRAQVQRAAKLYEQTVQVLIEDDEIIDSPEAQFQYGRANALFASIVSRSGMETPFPMVRQGFMRRMLFRDQRKPPKQSNEHFRAINESISVFELLADEHPDEVLYQVSLARAYRDRSIIAMRRREPMIARESINRSLDLFQALVESDRESDTIRYEYTKTLCSREALAFLPMIRLASAMRMSNELLKKYPDVARYRELKAMVLGQLSDLHARRSELDSAIRYAREESEIRAGLISDYPERVAYQTSQCQTLETLGDLSLRQGEPREARDYLDQAIALARTFVDADSIAPQAKNVRRRLIEKRNAIQP